MLGEARAPLGVPPPNAVGRALVVESFERVLADRLEETVSGAERRLVGDDERLVDELADAVEHVERFEAVAR